MLSQKGLCNGEKTGLQCTHYWFSVTKGDASNPESQRHGTTSRYCCFDLSNREDLGDGGENMAVRCNRYAPDGTRPYDEANEKFEPLTPEEIEARYTDKDRELARQVNPHAAGRLDYDAWVAKLPEDTAVVVWRDGEQVATGPTKVQFDEISRVWGGGAYKVEAAGQTQSFVIPGTALDPRTETGLRDRPFFPARKEFVDWLSSGANPPQRVFVARADDGFVCLRRNDGSLKFDDVVALGPGKYRLESDELDPLEIVVPRRIGAPKETP